LGTAKRILRYIASTFNYGIKYDSTTFTNLVGYCDSDWAGCTEDRRSTSGQIFLLGTSVISWSSKKQATVALSSAEAEYIALNSAACQAVWLRKILEDVGQMQQQPTPIYCDNQSAISMTKNPVFHGRSKHIDIRLHYIRDLVAEKTVEMKFVSSENQKADILTKALPLGKFESMRKKLGVMDFGSRGSVEN
jgi:hypothetical protein